LQWLALLAMAVVLPTASLLWFMSRVIADERLVVQQKLSALYQDKLTEASARTAALFHAQLAALDRLRPSGNPYPLFRRMVLESNFQGLVVWAADGSVVYPESAGGLGPAVSEGSPLAAAWHEEFANQQYSAAAELYARAAASEDKSVALSALTGESRCLSRLGRLDDAIGALQNDVPGSSAVDAGPAARLAIENARLLLLSLLKRSDPSPSRTRLFNRTLTALMGDLFYTSGDRALFPASENLFLAQKALESLQGNYRFEDAQGGDRLARLAAAEELSFAAAETIPPAPGVLDGVFRTASGQRPVYAFRHRSAASTVLVLLSDSGVSSLLSGYRDTFNGLEVSYRILDPSGDFVAGAQQPQGSAFAVSAMPGGFPGWKAELYFVGSDVFEKAARREIAVYTWTGGLVILLVLAAGIFAARAVSRQIRLNSMKNDFIATVSHELKTPLASMRVLIDTLLEGNVRDEAQVKDYLQLTAKENERLSRMIENFLTFSRMERNKKTFTISDAAPAAMVEDAVESVRTKYAAHNCHLEIEVANALPDIPADHDAIVTVLVNLLDNACKYTGEDKRITLKVFPSDGYVCFAVSDNGLGLARRHLRRIFDRFYQVDNSLARKAEGCGLGLSIVKFIVDAHKGKVAVESRPGAGSTFTVSLPVNRKNGG
jgi:nitrogen-specific signal transduction histidine kinase